MILCLASIVSISYILIRIAKTDVRARQVLDYGYHKINELSGEELFPHREPKLEDDFIRREIDEAIKKVVKLG